MDLLFDLSCVSSYVKIFKLDVLITFAIEGS